MVDSNFEGKIIAFTLSDNEWLEVLCDLEELNAPFEVLRLNARCRPHLSKHKRILGLEHLIQIN